MRGVHAVEAEPAAASTRCLASPHRPPAFLNRARRRVNVSFFSLALTRSSSLLPPLVVVGAYITDAWSGGQRFAAFVTFSWVSSIRSLGEADLECINGKGE